MSFRVGGLVTGLDTHSLVEQLMQLEKKPIQTLQARAKELQSRQSAWQGISSRVGNLETALTKLADLFKESALVVQSSSEALSVVKTGDIEMGTWQVQIERLAQSRTIASDQFTTVEPGEFSLNGFAIQLTEATDLRGLAAAINAAGNSNYNYNAISDGDIQVSGTYRGTTDSQLVVEVQERDLLVYKNGELVQTFTSALDGNGTGSVLYDGLEISFSQAQNGDSVEINNTAARDTGLTASVIDGRLVLNSDNHEAINFTDPQGILQGIGVLAADGTEKNVLVEGATALVRINGLLVERDSNIIDDVLSGITINLKESGEKTIELSAARDADGVTKAVAEIVDQLNALIKTLGPKGSVGSDTMAYRLEESFRRTLISLNISGTGEFGSLASIGISTTRSGELEFSAEKLQTAMEQDFSSLKDLIVGSSGIVEGLKTTCKLWSGSKGLIKTRLDTYQIQIRNNESSILRAEERSKLKEEQLWRQFAAMERALATIQNQGNWLAGQLGSLPGYGSQR